MVLYLEFIRFQLKWLLEADGAATATERSNVKVFSSHKDGAMKAITQQPSLDNTETDIMQQSDTIGTSTSMDQRPRRNTTN